MESNRKFVIALADGLQVEAVWYGSGTLCLSSQAGCAMACPFCASGRLGLRRNLSALELQEQVSFCRSQGVEPTRLTLSGIGEPLHNLPEVSRFVRSSAAAGLPVSLTTTGISLTLLPELLQLPHNGIMFSLHGATEALYRQLLPHGPGAAALHSALQALWPHLSRRQRRKLGVNYLLLEGVNDDPVALAALSDWMMPFPELTLHLLHCNPVPGSCFRSPDDSEQQRCYDYLRSRGIHVRRANRWRRCSEGGCGTLVLRGGGDLVC